MTRIYDILYYKLLLLLSSIVLSMRLEEYLGTNGMHGQRYCLSPVSTAITGTCKLFFSPSTLFKQYHSASSSS